MPAGVSSATFPRTRVLSAAGTEVAVARADEALIVEVAVLTHRPDLRGGLTFALSPRLRERRGGGDG